MELYSRPQNPVFSKDLSLQVRHLISFQKT